MICIQFDSVKECMPVVMMACFHNVLRNDAQALPLILFVIIFHSPSGFK